MTEPVDRELIDLLRGRDGLLTEVELADRRSLRVFNISWGYDHGDDCAHVFTNISPGIDDESFDAFFTREVALVKDPITESILFRSALDT